MVNTIEFVSDFHTGAELAEIVANEYIKKQRKTPHYKDVVVTSSGLLIDIPDHKWTYDLVLHILNEGKLVDASRIDVNQAKYESDPNYKQQIDRHAKQVHSSLLGVNVTHRVTLKQIIKSPLSYGSRQTQPLDQDYFDLIIALRDRSIPLLEALYQEKGVSCPEHVSLASYIGDSRELPSLHSRAISTAGPEYIALLRDTVPRAIDRFVQEHYHK